MRNLFLLFATLFAGLSAAQIQCTASSGVPPLIRDGGLTELVGDYIMDCIGGTPTAAGQPVPAVNITVTLNAPLTSNPLAGGFNESLLIIDEPNSSLHPSRGMLNCEAPGAADNGGSAGTCAIISTGDPDKTYDGTPNGYGASATCDGVGHPAANTYQCGRPNLFQGQIDAAPNVVKFIGVPFDPPGPNGHRVLRFTNFRVAPQRFAAGSLVLQTMTMSVSINSSLSIAIANREIQVASVLQGFTDLSGNLAEGPLTAPIRFREGFPSSWRMRNVSATVGDNLGTLGNGTWVGNSWIYNNGTHNPADVAQNVPGAVYNTEEGYTWQNNGDNAPPASNPPLGFGTSTGFPLAGGPLVSAGFGGTNTNISLAGVAQSGTRFAIRFTNIPIGGSVTLPTSVSVVRAGDTTVTGVMALTATDAAGAGPYMPRSGTFTSTDSLAVYEVLFAQPYIIEDVNIPFTTTGFPQGTTPHGITSLAPFYSSASARSANSTLPEPRFIDPCLSLPCLTVSPGSGRTGDMVNVNIDATLSLSADAAAQMMDGAQVTLVASGQTDITATSANFSGRTLTAALNLAGAPLGPRDVVVTNPSGAVNAVPNGFTVDAALPCTFTAGPLTASFPPSGGSGSIVVSPLPVDCTWFASTSYPWITLNARQGGQWQFYTVQSALNGPNRTGTINIAGHTVTVIQAGTYDSAVNARVVFRANDSSIRVMSYASDTAINAGGVLASSPGSTTDINNKTVVAARDAYNGIWINTFDPSTQLWSGWHFGGGVVAGDPSVAATPDGTAWIAARDQYNSYWLVSYTTGGFGSWTALHGVFGTDPAVAACPDGSIYIVGKDNFNALWSGHYIPGVGFQGFQPGGGVVQGSPSVTCANNGYLHIGVRDNANSNWIARVSGDIWIGWSNIGGVSSIDPKIAATATGSSVALVTLDSGGAVWSYQAFNSQWTLVGGVLEDIAPSSVNGELFFIGKAPDQALWWWQQTGSAWTPAGNTGLVSGALSVSPR